MDLGPVDRITADAIGEPGERTFYIQARAGTELVTVIVEKQQVQLLAASVLELLEEAPPPEASIDEPLMDLEQPVDPRWRAGRLSIGFDHDRDLFLLEEELLFPANTQVAVFVSMDVGEFFGLDSVELKLDNKDVANYLYTERESDALLKGGVQRLFLGNLKAGEHELVAVFTGEGPHTRDYRRAASLKFEKGIGPKYIELTISDRESKQQPEFVVKEWE